MCATVIWDVYFLFLSVMQFETLLTLDPHYSTPRCVWPVFRKLSVNENPRSFGLHCFVQAYKEKFQFQFHMNHKSFLNTILQLYTTYTYKYTTIYRKTYKYTSKRANYHKTKLKEKKGHYKLYLGMTD